MVTNWSVRQEKHQTIETLLMVDFYAFSKCCIFILNEMDLIQSELCNFDVICITESWLDDRTSDDDIKIENFKLFRRDRPGDHHGGICVYVRNNVFFKKKTRS